MNFTKKSLIISSLSALLCSSLLADETYNIKSGLLTDSIKKISQISNMTYMGDTRILKGIKAPSLKNISGVKKALTEVLRNSNLEAIIKDNVIIIRKKENINTNSSNQLQSINVIDSSSITENTNSYTINTMSTATKMDLSILDTPQSVSVITKKKIDDFNLNTMNDVLLNTPGISVESYETDRTRYTARGFDVTNILVDGTSMPLSYGISAIGVDTALFDRVEVTKGATGLMSGAGDPSATINMIRKKPTADLTASVDLIVGSWNKKRIVADISNALNDSKSIRGRLVSVAENSESFMDRYEKDKTLIYGIIEADITDDLLFTVGASRLNINVDNAIWGLPLTYSDGTPTDYDLSFNPSADWSYRDTTQTEIFSKLQYSLNNSWNINANATYKKMEVDTKSFYIASSPDPITNAATGGSSHNQSTTKDKSLDIHMAGDYSLFDMEQQAVFGLSYAKRDNDEVFKYGAKPGDAYPSIPNITNFNGNTPLPSFTDRERGAEFTEEQKAFYAASKINFTKNFFTLVGARLSTWEVDGEGYGKDKTSKNSNVFTPYLGFVFKFNEDTSTYASYTTSFTPSGAIDINENTLDPASGENFEIGIKRSFYENKLNTSFSVFQTKQDNVAETAGKLSDGRTYSSSEDGVTSKGFEVEMSGEISDNLAVSFGYTRLNIKDKDGDQAKTYIPKNQITFSTNYRLSSIPKLQIGAGLNWQDDIYRVQATLANGTQFIREEKAYLIANLMANYSFNKNLSLKLNINNITNTKYISSLYSSEGVYGTPRATYLSLKYKF
jgi:outer membrane receptor for ferric coprogen and ferric-rhodotorulic acid